LTHALRVCVKVFFNALSAAQGLQLQADHLSWRRPTGWRFWPVVIWGNPRGPECIGDMSHKWIGVEVATAVRRMLLRENGGTLEHFRGVRDSCWEGEEIVLRDLATTFRTAYLTARRESSRVVVDLDLTGPAPKGITVRHPGARTVGPAVSKAITLPRGALAGS
jgi:hypothetical protein